MTDWRAVGWGFLVLLVVAIFGAGIPVLGQIGAGLVGGFVAGYLAGGSLGSGAWHGLVAGSLTGVVFTVLLALAGGLVSGPAAPLVGGGVLVVGLFVTFLFAIDSAIAGALGAVLKD
jgi:hypothetical protein